jgi:hypothetical protein
MNVPEMFLPSTHSTFDWPRAIERNSEALKAVVTTLYAMLGLAGGAAVARLPESIYRSVLRVLRPAESAVRRLVVIAARGLVVKPAQARPMPAKPIVKGKARSRPAFRLFDPRKSFVDVCHVTGPRILPRIHVFGPDPRVAALWAARARSNPASQQDDGLFNSRRLVRRLQALKAALDNLPHQARRLVRARARRDKIPRLKFLSPLRPGPPPGHRKVKLHEIDEILAECHGLARDALKIDSS